MVHRGGFPPLPKGLVQASRTSFAADAACRPGGVNRLGTKLRRARSFVAPRWCFTAASSAANAIHQVFKERRRISYFLPHLKTSTLWRTRNRLPTTPADPRLSLPLRGGGLPLFGQRTGGGSPAGTAGSVGPSTGVEKNVFPTSPITASACSSETGNAVVSSARPVARGIARDAT